MTETPAATSNGQEAAAQSRSAYLPVPPTGWDYTVRLAGPHAEVITVRPSSIYSKAAQGIVTVTVVTADTEKEFDAPSIKEGTKAAANAAKALQAIAEHEKSAADAKQKLLDTIGVQVDEEPKASRNGKPAAEGEAKDATATTGR